MESTHNKNAEATSNGDEDFTVEAVSGATVMKELFGPGEEWATLEQSKDISKDEEANLAVFLQKLTKACDNDKSVPTFVGDQVNEWLKEL